MLPFFKKLAANFGLNYTLNSGRNTTSDIFLSSNPQGGFSFVDEIKFDRRNFLEDYTAFAKFDFTPNNQHFIRFGIESTVHQYQTNVSDFLTTRKNARGDSTFLEEKATLNSPILRGYESAVYIEDDITFTPNLVVNAGLRASHFWDRKINFINLEPRFSLRWTVPNVFTINATAAKMVQYSHALLSNEIGLEKLVWVPSSEKILPQTSWTYTAGLSKRFKKWQTNVSLEAFYKKMENLSQFLFFADFGESVFHNWQQNIITGGRGEAYGLEFMIDKTEGRFNGALSYTLAWNNRTFRRPQQRSSLSFQIRPSPHSQSFLAAINSPKVWKLGALFTFNTGFWLTIPDGQLVEVPFFQNTEFLYTAINNSKMPNFHRLDLNAAHEKRLKMVISAHGASISIMLTTVLTPFLFMPRSLMRYLKRILNIPLK
ncbi:MAG: TonB-dependent receptor [Saprospiraceae bacterium]|nr:TonB-dependent receptor [Saprospiraceae bacterium]